jgi:peptidoglycan/LPS O-acetylase OafA/YrhL
MARQTTTEPPRWVVRLTQASLALSGAAALTWILATPSDPHDDPYLWVGLLTFIWHFLLGPIVNFGLLVGASLVRKKFSMRAVAFGAAASLFVPFLGQLIGGLLWASGQGPLSIR